MDDSKKESEALVAKLCDSLLFIVGACMLAGSLFQSLDQQLRPPWYVAIPAYAAVYMLLYWRSRVAVFKRLRAITAWLTEKKENDNERQRNA